MILAELEVYHSRPVAPTRRVALGRRNLPVDPPPGFGGILLGGIVAANVGEIDPDLLPDLSKLTTQLENGLRISQPRLRHRFQKDTVGLQASTHRLLDEDEVLSFSFDHKGDPAQQVLAAVYAAGELPARHRRAVMGTIRRAMGWSGPIGPELITALAGFNTGVTWSTHALTHPVEWALDVLGFNAVVAAGAPAGAGARLDGGTGTNGNGGNGRASDGNGAGPSKGDIQRQYRRMLIDAHPDHGGEAEGAAQRIADITEARRILLG
jgi:hypothetical protein